MAIFDMQKLQPTVAMNLQIVVCRAWDPSMALWWEKRWNGFTGWQWCLLKWVDATYTTGIKNYPMMKMCPLWELLHSKYKEMFPNLFTVVSVALAIPVISVDCEWGFSTQNRIKWAYRSTIASGHLVVLMQISIQGPPIEEFDFWESTANLAEIKSQDILVNSTPTTNT